MDKIIQILCIAISALFIIFSFVKDFFDYRNNSSATVTDYVVEKIYGESEENKTEAESLKTIINSGFDKQVQNDIKSLIEEDDISSLETYLNSLLQGNTQNQQDTGGK